MKTSLGRLHLLPAFFVFAALTAFGTSAFAQQREEVVAAAGSPFGVGKLTVALPRGVAVSPTADDEFTLTEKNGRALYPAYANTPVRGLLRNFLDRPQMVTVYFLFTGDGPLDLRLYAPTGISRTVAPINEPNLQRRLLGEWWREYTSGARRSSLNDEYPQLVDVYTTSMLARRLNLPLLDPGRRWFGKPQTEMTSALELLSGAETVRADALRTISLGIGLDAAPANQPLPQAVSMAPLELPDAPADLQVEPIAMHVPAECLYLRFGSFNNYQWFRTRMDEWGGDLRTLISARGLNFNINAKQEQQLSLHETALSALLGPTVISDVALIADDPFFREGAAMGMLFQARNSLALSSDFTRQRLAAQAADKEVTEKQVKIAGHNVSLLSTPDNRVRSFYAIDGDYHLVTTSRAMVERFYAAGGGDRPLGAARDFRHARTVLPLARDDSIFAFLSSDFFRQLAGPHYQIEMNRRLKAAAEIDLYRIAQLAARMEGKPATSVEQLVAASLLPRGFSQRPDGSRVELDSAGRPQDSLRGGLGTFLPIPDVQVDKVGATEAAEYGRFAEAFASQVGRFDPIAAAVKRLGEENSRERVEIAVRMLPLAEKHYAWARQILGPPSRQHLAPLADDLVSFEGVVSGNLLAMLQAIIGGGGQHDPYHIFFGLKNDEAAFDFQQGQFAPRGGFLRSVPFYLGGWPTTGILQILGIGRPEIPLDADGYGQGRLFAFRTVGPITVGSPRRDMVAAVSPQLKLIDAPQPGQFWLHVGDVSQSKMAQFSNAMGYSRAREITIGNSHFLHSLSTQLGVAPEQALTVAEPLLDAQLVSPIGGHYELAKAEGQFPIWESTALKDQGSGMPAGYLSPPLDWFRGLDADLVLEESQLSVNAQIIMQRKEKK